ncbi:MAG: GIY-YIG nuclease family protein [Candidatus Thioglobus sp.]
MSIKDKLKNLTNQPGVYQMLDGSGKIIYVGKARNLKKRVSQYFSKKQSDAKTIALVSNIDGIDVIVTDTETQALLLENELIKEHKPRYNILLKDAKSYPYIYVTSDKHPRVGFFRGNKTPTINTSAHTLRHTWSETLLCC